VDEELEDVQAERDQLREELKAAITDRDEFAPACRELQTRINDAVRTLEHG
jgi:uncharacterized coiled-coil DUF342 family protein